MTSHGMLPAQQKAGNRLITFLAVLVALVLVFTLGLGIGNGTIQIKKDAVSSNTNKKELPEDLDYATVEAVYDMLKSSYDGKLEHDKLLDGLKQGLASATGDPYTEFFNITEAEDFDAELNGSFTGIGAELGKNENGNIVIIAPLAGFPAEKAGLKAKDIVAEIDDQSAAGLTVSEAVKKIRGPKDTKVKLTVIRNNQEVKLEITRAEIKIPSVKYEITGDNIGILTISRFGPDTSTLAKQAANKFKEANVRGVIVDMRSNPGGLLDAAVDVSSLWLTRDQTVLQEKRDGVVKKTFKSDGTATLKGIKTVVLIDEGSASASEITAGALRDNNVATLIGVKSYGKGSVQTLEKLRDGTLLKVTSAHWFTPSGKGIDKTGIEPDQKIERTDADFQANRDPQKDAALKYLLQ